MQQSNRRARFGRWFLLFWAAAVLAMMLVSVLRQESPPRYDGAMFVRLEAGCSRA